MMNCSSLKNTAMKVLGAGAFMGSLLLGAGRANAEEAQIPKEPVKTSLFDRAPETERRIILDFKDPLKDADANTKLFYSGTQLVGKLSDELARNTDIDKSLLGRLGQVVVVGFLDNALAFYSHEAGHIREGRRDGGYSAHINWDDWNEVYPNFTFRWKYNPSLERDEKNTVAGLNQDELDARFIHANTLDRIKFDEGAAFLSTKFADCLYILTQPNVHSGGMEAGDIGTHLNELEARGIHLTKEDLFAQSLLADALSAKTWDSLFATLGYIDNGQRERECMNLEIGDLKITPPLFSCYLTNKGGFFESSTRVSAGKNKSLDIIIGHDADCIGDGEVNTLRAGARYEGINVKDRVLLIPFAYKDVSRDKLNSKGYSAGLDAEVQLGKTWSLTAGARYAKNDIIEDWAKGNENGWNVAFGLIKRF
jgi:outer membrane receptor protein involved in Fe transport